MTETKPCRACKTHAEHMRKVWEGLAQEARERLVGARRSRKTDDARRFERLVEHYTEKAKGARKPPEACAHREKWARAARVSLAERRARQRPGAR